MKILTGNSTAVRDFANTSAVSSRTLPIIPLKRQDDRLLCPVRSLAVCGARRPIKLISPVTLTAAATVSVARKSSDARKTSHDPVFDGSQLFFRVSHELQHHEKCLRQGVDRDPRENNGRVFLYWGKGGESKGQTNCEKSADKREDRGGRRCGGGKKDCEGGTCAGTGRDADDIGGRQRVPEDRLVDEPGHTEAKAADESHEGAGQAEYGKGADRHRFPCAKIRQGDRVLSGS